ncbi:hypothetical protein CCHR01_10228 [Colletotrichum chrysophilum]|uniref:Uncharacterized protein n=1 Tax=Colletotrichum chrysophilum TaxID=1836956 RepID=A0AAD9AGA9_9PEZI|nr:hypothetical protein CCHR01_10228 [Colletotrichum chrysophilum]
MPSVPPSSMPPTATAAGAPQHVFDAIQHNTSATQAGVLNSRSRSPSRLAAFTRPLTLTPAAALRSNVDLAQANQLPTQTLARAADANPNPLQTAAGVWRRDSVPASAASLLLRRRSTSSRSRIVRDGFPIATSPHHRMPSTGTKPPPRPPPPRDEGSCDAKSRLPCEEGG